MNMISETPAVATPPKAYDAITRRPAHERGAWLATSRGGIWSIMHPHPGDVFIDDIAWGIARECRYSGQIRSDLEMYTVAEHCCIMTWWAIDNKWTSYQEDALAILLHDASEAFYGDMSTPIKQLIPEFRKLENMAQGVITHAFGLNPNNTLITKAQIKEIDKRIRIDERIHIIREPALTVALENTRKTEPGLEPLEITPECLLPGQARAAFLNCFVWVLDHLPPRDPEILPHVEYQRNTMMEQFSGIRPGTVSRHMAGSA